MNYQIEPKWVLVNGELRNVSEFVDLPPRLRPFAICPVCRGSVIMKLGNERVHHYAHHTEAICATTQPETALHLNTKLHIYKQLLDAQEIYVSQQCSTRGCSGFRQLCWLSNWDTVQVEYTIDSYRPDVALLQSKQVIGAIEVLVTHRVSLEKKQYFKNNNIPWLEIQATPEIYSGKNAWSPDAPLPVAAFHIDTQSWICDECNQKEAEKETNRQRVLHHIAQQQEQQQYKADVQKRQMVLEARMVDLYFKSGKKYREAFYIKQVIDPDTGEILKVMVSQENGNVLASESPMLLREEAVVKLKKAVEEYLQSRQSSIAIMDDIKPWAPWIRGEKFVPRDIDRFPFGYNWDNDDRRWIRDDLLFF